MSESHAQRIITAIIERMQTISTANGFWTDIGADVRDWETFAQQDELPILSICDMTTDIEWANREWDAAMHVRTMNIQFRIITAGETRPQVLRQMLRDIEKAIGEDQCWTSEDGETLALNTRIRRSGMIPQQRGDSFEIGASIIEAQIDYLTPVYSA